MDIGDSGIRDFKKIANKYGVDFAIVKDKDVDPPKYTVFFKARDADALTVAFKEYSAAVMKKKDRPSVLNALKKMKELVVPRQVFAYIAKDLTQTSLSTIGRKINRDHTTILHSINKVEIRLKEDEELLHSIEMVKNLLTDV